VEFDWDANNVQHIARHGISPKEAEDAIKIEPLEADVQPHDSEERVLCFGRGKIRVVTAYEMTKPQQQMYFEGK